MRGPPWRRRARSTNPHAAASPAEVDLQQAVVDRLDHLGGSPGRIEAGDVCARSVPEPPTPRNVREKCSHTLRESLGRSRTTIPQLLA